MQGSASSGRLMGALVAASHVTTLEQLPAVVAEHAARAGWPQVLIYLADLEQTSLFLLPGEGWDPGRRYGPVRTELPIEGTVAGRVFQLGRITRASATRTDQWWVPLLDGTDRLGVLRVTTSRQEELEEETARDLRLLAGVLSLIVVAKSQTSDVYARVVRRRRMNVAAEMEWNLTPPRTLTVERALISAIMEPAYAVSGDAYDYAVADGHITVCLFDAMGHDAAAGLTANLAVAACRNHRRRRDTLPRMARAVDEALTEQFEGDRFVTGVLADLDTTTGVLRWTSRGHHPPVVIRNGRTVVSLDCPPGPPMGTGLTAEEAPVCREQLEPGDRLVLYTDGITEARSRGGQEFGLRRFTDFLLRHHIDALPVPETLRRLMRHHMDYHGGRLADDATVVLLEWHGPTPYSPAGAEARAGLPEHTTPADVLSPVWPAPDDAPLEE